MKYDINIKYNEHLIKRILETDYKILDNLFVIPMSHKYKKQQYYTLYCSIDINYLNKIAIGNIASTTQDMNNKGINKNYIRRIIKKQIREYLIATI